MTPVSLLLLPGCGAHWPLPVTVPTQLGLRKPKLPGAGRLLLSIQTIKV